MKIVPHLLKKIKNEKTTLALSAGADSVAMCHFLKTNFPKLDLQCFHFNHKLREQNEIMQEKAYEFSKFLNVPFVVESRQKDVLDFSESVLRSARYKAMRGLGLVATAHHLDDAVENYLYNCFNGVPEYLPMPLQTEYFGCDLTVIRPMIFTEKQQIMDYISDNNLSSFVVEDESNKDLKYRRNWLRQQVIPLVQQNYNLKTVVRKRYNEYLLKQKTNL